MLALDLATDLDFPQTGTGELQQCQELQCRKILLPVLSIQIQQSQGFPAADDNDVYDVEPIVHPNLRKSVFADLCDVEPPPFLQLF